MTMLGFLLKTVAILGLLALITVVACNMWQTVDVLLVTKLFRQLPLGVLLLGAATVGFLAAWFWVMPSVLQHRSAHHKTRRQLEKTQVASESHASQIKALQAKIETLEVALDKSIAASAFQPPGGNA